MANKALPTWKSSSVTVTITLSLPDAEALLRLLQSSDTFPDVVEALMESVPERRSASHD
ncbi:MAG: hypothetical protein ABFE13_11550 [Phycisphaerales bacterium]